MKKILLSILVQLYTYHFIAQDSVVLKSKWQLEGNIFYNVSFSGDWVNSFYQGQNLLLSYEKKIKQSTFWIGLSIGCFYNQCKYNKSNFKKMHYTFFPIYLTLSSKKIDEKISYRIRFGLPFLSYFDSEYEFYEDFLYNQMWPNKSMLEFSNENRFIERRKPFYILSYDMQWSVYKNFGISLGATTYYSRALYFYLNTGVFWNFLERKNK